VRTSRVPVMWERRKNFQVRRREGAGGSLRRRSGTKAGTGIVVCDSTAAFKVARRRGSPRGTRLRRAYRRAYGESSVGDLCRNCVGAGHKMLGLSGVIPSEAILQKMSRKLQPNIL